MLDRIKTHNPTLVKTILDRFSDTDIKTKIFFDPEVGSGEILKEVEERKRRAGCTNKEIYDTVIGFVPTNVQLNYLKRKIKPIGNYQVVDFLKQGCNMKFDHVVTNPPYQDATNKAKNNKLWPKFIKLLMNKLPQNGYISAITPDSIFKSDVGYGKIFKAEMDQSFSLIAANLHIEKQFDASITTTDWCIKKSINENKIEYPILRDPIVDDILKKVLAYPKMIKFDIENGEDIVSYKVEKDAATKQYIIPPGASTFYNSNKNLKYTFDKLKNGGLKYVVSFSASYHGMFITNEPTGAFNRVVFINTEDEGNNIISYANSLLFRFHASHYLKTSGFTPAVKNNKVPDLGSDKIWTDDEIFTKFKLTIEEIEYVKNEFIKKDSKSCKKS